MHRTFFKCIALFSNASHVIFMCIARVFQMHSCVFQLVQHWAAECTKGGLLGAGALLPGLPRLQPLPRQGPQQEKGPQQLLLQVLRCGWLQRWLRGAYELQLQVNAVNLYQSGLLFYEDLLKIFGKELFRVK